jgi:hypothetical protein
MNRILLLFAIGVLLFSQSSGRFESVSFDEITPRNTSSPANAILLNVIHDRESGQEIVCARSGVAAGYAISCWTTGRNWK